MYYDDCLIEELQAYDEIFSKSIDTNFQWNIEKENMFQDIGVYSYDELGNDELSYLMIKADEITLKYHINLKEELEKLGM